MKKLGKLFGFNKKKAEEPEPTKASAKKGAVAQKGVKANVETKPKKTGWW